MRLRTVVLIAMISGAVPAARAAPASSDVELAQERFQTGRRLYKEGRFAEALAAFREAQAPVASPNVRLYIGRCLLALGKVPEAYEELGGAKRDAASMKSADPKYAATETAAAEEQRALAPRVGMLRLVLVGAPPDASVRVGGRAIPLERLGEAIPVAPGKVPVDVDAPGYVRLSQTLQVAPGQSEEVRVELQKEPARAEVPPPHEEPKREEVKRAELKREPPPPAIEARPPSWATVGMWTGLGLGVAGLGGFTAFFVAADDTHQQLVQDCINQPCAPDHSSALRTRGRNLQTATNVSLAVGAAGLAIGATSFFLGRAFPEREPIGLGTDGRRVFLAAEF